MLLWPVIHLDHPRRDVGKPFSHGLPPRHESVYQAITGHLRCDPLDQQLVQRWEKDADGGEGGRGVKVVVDRCDGGTRLAPPREGADVDGGLGLHGAASDVVRRLSGLMDRGHVGEDRFGCWDFFGG